MTISEAIQKNIETEWEIHYYRKPMPDRKHDWEWVHKEYDGPGDRRHGTAPSRAACEAAIKEYIMENIEAFA